jgi:hypothetical protein
VRPSVTLLLQRTPAGIDPSRLHPGLAGLGQSHVLLNSEHTRMATPTLTPGQIAQISGLVARYIAEQRERYAPRAVPLSLQQRAAMGGFFSP